MKPLTVNKDADSQITLLLDRLLFRAVDEMTTTLELLGRITEAVLDSSGSLVQLTALT